MFVLFPVDSCCKIKIQCGWCNRSCNPREIAGSLRVTAGLFISFRHVLRRPDHGRPDMLTSGYITLQEAIEATPISYLANRALLPNLLQILLLFLTVLCDPYILKKQRRIMFIIIALELSLVLQDLVSAYLNMHNLPPMLRTIQSIYGYSARPVVVLLFFYIIEPDKNYKLFWWLAGVNAAVFLTALFSPVAFRIREDNRFIRGPLGYTGHLVSGIMLAYLLYLVLLEAKRTRNPMTLIPILSVLFIIGAVLLDSKIDATKDGLGYLTISIISCSLFSYIWLHLKFVREHEEALMTEQRVQIMLTQIRPHFLYNSLTVIQDLCRTNPEQAENATIQFAKYLRGNMDALQINAPIPFTEELEHTKEYLSLEQMRFEEKLTVRYDIQCEAFSLPPLTLEPIVENAVRHGVRGNSDGRGEVAIATREYPDHYEITVTDTGPGFDPEKLPKDQGRSHIGLQNVREQLAQMCNGALNIASAPGKGTCVTITIPKGMNAR